MSKTPSSKNNLFFIRKSINKIKENNSESLYKSDKSNSKRKKIPGKNFKESY